ncbi:hypothetical protein BH09PSE3_BH09PSE3_23340 [soil metagenome]
MIHSDPIKTRLTIRTPNPERLREHVVGVVGTVRDVQEEDEVNAHLGNRQNA